MPDADWWEKVRRARDGETVKDAPPLAEEELLDAQAAVIDTNEPFAEMIETQTVRRMAEELRRLRSDEWLEKAASEIAGAVQAGLMRPGHSFDRAAAILRKHREGKA
jgi:hypothetical protein